MEEVKQLKVKKKRKLTAKQEGFVKDFLETKNASEAVRRNYNVLDAKSSEVTAIASENLAKPSIQERVEELRGKMVTDSYWMYERQKEILETALSANNLELGNKIINKVIDRAGLMPVYKQESKHITAKYTFTRGSSTPPITDVPRAE